MTGQPILREARVRQHTRVRQQQTSLQETSKADKNFEARNAKCRGQKTQVATLGQGSAPVSAPEKGSFDETRPAFDWISDLRLASNVSAKSVPHGKWRFLLMDIYGGFLFRVHKLYLFASTKIVKGLVKFCGWGRCFMDRFSFCIDWGVLAYILGLKLSRRFHDSCMYPLTHLRFSVFVFPFFCMFLVAIGALLSSFRV